MIITGVGMVWMAEPAGMAGMFSALATMLAGRTLLNV